MLAPEPRRGVASRRILTTVDLVVDAGFDPVVVGPLARAREFDRGTAVYVTGMSAAEIRGALGLG